VPLVEELPPLPRRTYVGGDPEDPLTYDLADWSDDQRDGISLLLRVADIVHEWDGGLLTVAPSAEAEVDAWVDEIDSGEIPGAGDVEALAEVAPDEEAEVGPTIAGPLRRIGGALIDGWLITLVLLPVGGSFHGPTPFAVRSAYEIACFGQFGRTIGMRLLGMRAVRRGDEGRPGWGRSIVRFAVATAAAPLGWAGRIGLVLAAVYGVVVFAGIFRGPWHQGLHDRAAGLLLIQE